MINSLQSIRYLLALMIFVHHYVYPPYNPFGDFPVAFFFILSGYVMIFSAIVPPQYELASLYWIPSISIILVFATFGPRGYISEVLNKKWMSSMGSYSFPIYIIHFIAIRYYRPLIAHLGFEPNNLVWISLGTVIMTLLAYAYVNKVEPVIQRVLV